MPAAGEIFLGIIKARSHQPAAGGNFFGHFKAKTAFLLNNRPPEGPNLSFRNFVNNKSPPQAIFFVNNKNLRKKLRDFL